MSKNTILLFLLSVSLVFACVEPYDLTLRNQTDILFVDAQINDIDPVQKIYIRRSYSTKNSDIIEGEIDAEVNIFENEVTKYSCISLGNGIYQIPENLKVKAGNKYHLEFKLRNGKKYKSGTETPININEIEKLTAFYRTTGINYDGKSMNGHEVYLDTKDDVSNKNFYMWTWKLFEKQNYCISCFGGKYYTNPLPDGQCVEDANLKRRGVIYDYSCNGNCWDKFYSSEINILSDQYYNGASITNRKIASIPFFQYYGTLIEVAQLNISKAAYDYFKIMMSQSQNTGTLSDTPPAGLVGNIKNINDSTEPIGGMFMAGIKKTKRLWIPRSERHEGIKAYGLFQGRLPNPEPMGMDLTRPPLAPCKESNYRTPIMPEGWVN